jgi:hypothetical protein
MNMMEIERALRLSGMTTAANHLAIVQLARHTTKVDDPRAGAQKTLPA